MENENFYGWGLEDSERVKRWEILDYKIYSANGALFHLCHPRSKNSQFASSEIMRRNFGELIRITRMSKAELIDEIKSWTDKKSIRV